LGVAGSASREGNATTYECRLASLADVWGAWQMFRREGPEAIGGYRPTPAGWSDLIAVRRPRASGGATRTSPDNGSLHHRTSGSAQSTGIRARLHRGRKDYLLGSHPAWEVLRSIHQTKNRPYLVGGILILVGYFWAMLRRAEKSIPEELVELRRNDQLRRLRGILRSESLPETR